MIEHRLIERMITLIDERARKTGGDERIDPAFIDAAIDFIRTYADRTHHGKEEDILFRDLSGKTMSEDDARLMAELVEEHKLGRRLVGELSTARDDYAGGDERARALVFEKLAAIAAFYPKHIEKEDRVFFPASMTYLNDSEKEAMLEEMREFDMKMIHQKYATVVDAWDGRGGKT